MSRELLGLVVFTVFCIIISPFYKEVTRVHTPVKPVYTLAKRTTVQTDNPKTIVFLSDKFLPTTFAGSELSGYETLKYMRERGHTIIIFVKQWKVSDYDGFSIYKYDQKDPICVTTIVESDIVFFQMGDETEHFEIIKHRNKPVYMFIHNANHYYWILQQKLKFPVHVVYNSHMTQDEIPTLHDNMRMIPYVDTSRFKPLRSISVSNNVVCLINCSKNKGGDIFKQLATKLTNVQFLGVKGAYGIQSIDQTTPDNLTYIENQKDITVVFRRIGILLMPSKNETWGRTAVEAMASGVPVIHSQAVGLVECVGGAGILCSLDDIDAWADAIRRIVGDPAYREHLRQNGFKRVKEIEIEQERGRQELAIKVERR